MAKISASFLAAATKAMFNPSEWRPVGEKVSLKDYWEAVYPGLYGRIDGDEAEITATEFADGQVGLRIAVPIKDSDPIELKLSGKSTLEEGDVVKISSLVGQELHKVGSDPIVRWDGEAVDEE